MTIRPEHIYTTGGNPLKCTMILKKLQHTAGVTLLELVVSVGLFTVIILSATGIFQMVVNGQRSALSAQNIQENIRYIFEVMSKEIRTAGISNGSCKTLISPEPTPLYKVYNTASAGTVLYFQNKNGDCVAYYLENNRLKIIRAGTANFVTPSAVKINNIKFLVTDDLIGAFHSLQPQVNIIIDAEVVGKDMHKQSMKIQTSISSRYYE